MSFLKLILDFKDYLPLRQFFTNVHHLLLHLIQRLTAKLITVKTQRVQAR